MLEAPPIDHAQLKTAIQREYGVQAHSLTFIPKGFTAAAYRLTSTSGDVFFVKLWPATTRELAATNRRWAGLRLTRALHDRGILTNISYPLRNLRGELHSAVSTFTFALFPFIAGEEPDFEASPELWEVLAKTFALLHRATPSYADINLPQETFDLSALDKALNNTLRLLEQPQLDPPPGYDALRKLLLPLGEEVLTQLARLYTFQHEVRRLPRVRVLCHTDAGSSNLLVDARGDLYVLDWDEAMLAPPEHDLQEARASDMGRILKVYWGSGGVQRLHLAHFAFYLLRRHLGDMSARCERILYEEPTAEQLDEALEGIELWGVRQWRVLEHTLSHLDDAL